MVPFPLAALRRRPLLLATLVAVLLVALAVALTFAPVDARPMLDPCTYERPVCPTYAPR